jgi:hypothetical protein
MSKLVLKQTIKEQIEYQDEKVVEGYEIQKVKDGLYSYGFLQRLCIWLDETIELNCKRLSGG